MRQKQKKTDKKTFTGMFNRGEVYNENEDASSSAVSQELPDDPVEKQIHDAEQLVGIYERQEKWDKAEDACRAAASSLDVNWSEEPGEAAFYGPKIDIKVFDAMERMHQCATVQLDFQ